MIFLSVYRRAGVREGPLAGVLRDCLNKIKVHIKNLNLPVDNFNSNVLKWVQPVSDRIILSQRTGVNE